MDNQRQELHAALERIDQTILRHIRSIADDSTPDDEIAGLCKDIDEMNSAKYRIEELLGQRTSSGSM